MTLSIKFVTRVEQIPWAKCTSATLQGSCTCNILLKRDRANGNSCRGGRREGNGDEIFSEKQLYSYSIKDNIMSCNYS